MGYETAVREWFKTGLKPTQAQFWAKFSFLRWKDENIPAGDIQGLDQLLTDKADDERVTNLFKKVRFIEVTEFLIFKTNLEQPDELIAGMIVKGIVENCLIEGIYLGGDSTLKASFEILTSADL